MTLSCDVTMTFMIHDGALNIKWFDMNLIEALRDQCDRWWL